MGFREGKKMRNFVIFGLVFVFLAILGVKLGRWAEAESQATEARFSEAMSVIGR